MVRGFLYMGCHKLANAGIGVGAILRWLYDRGQRLWGGIPYPRVYGSIPRGGKNPRGRTGASTRRVGPREELRSNPGDFGSIQQEPGPLL